MIGGGELRLGEGRGHQGVMGEQVDLARQAGGGLVERFFGGGVEERDGGAGELEAMRQVRRAVRRG